MVSEVPITKLFDPNKPNPFLSSKFKRRCPNTHFYISIECPSGRNCNDGTCPLAHTKLEIIFHPIVYKTRRCKKATMGVCNFFQKCAFYNSESDRVAAQLLWLVWEKTWDLWRTNIGTVLSNHNKFNNDICRRVSMMMNYRGNQKKLLKTLNDSDDAANILLNHLDSSSISGIQSVNSNPYSMILSNSVSGNLQAHSPSPIDIINQYADKKSDGQSSTLPYDAAIIRNLEKAANSGSTVSSKVSTSETFPIEKMHNSNESLSSDMPSSSMDLFSLKDYDIEQIIENFALM